MHNLKTNFDKIFPIVKDSLNNFLDSDGNTFKSGRKPKFSDLELITLSITAEALSISSENLLFHKLKSDYASCFTNLIDRSQFNRRRRFLTHYIQQAQKYLAKQLSDSEDTFLIDSMPIPICRFARARRLKICKHSLDTAPDYGFCAAQNSHYFGYKLHGVCSLDGIFTDFDLSKASIHDIHYLQDIKDNYPHCLLLGDKGYLNAMNQLDLFETYHLNLQTPLRKNQKDYKPQPKIFRKTRKRIETLFSQLHDQFHIYQNYAKSFSGLAVRILSKITALTVLQFINKLNNKPLNHIKHALI
ncbi:MAG: IS982 family transposase [Candidatus Marinimicrobia bacterium]|nr:IS982 family transposase [Candidatus Neomarinimicrobiota bacterium]